MRGNPIRGMGYLFKGFKLLPEPGIRTFVIIPLVINTLLFVVAISLLVSQFGGWVDYFLSYLPDWSWLSLLHWLLWPLFALLVILVVYYTFTLVTNFIAAPFNGVLSEKVEQRLRGERVTDEGFKALVAMIPAAIAREFAKLAYFIPRFLFVLIVSFIPVVNLIAPVLWFAFGAWMMAIQYCDYPMDNNKVSFKDMRRLLKQDRLTALGFGGLIQMVAVVPLINFLIMPVAVIGATYYWVEEYAADE